MRLVLFICFLFVLSMGRAQTAESQIQEIVGRMDSIQGFRASVLLQVDISFIQMPNKNVDITYHQGEELLITSENFTLLPKRGLDVTFQELFEYPYLVVARETPNNTTGSERIISILPKDDRAAFSIATLKIDTIQRRIISADISTKKDGTYTVSLFYPATNAILPNEMRIVFEMDRIRIPLNFAGKDVVIDRKKMREQEMKQGSIILQFNYQDIQY